MNTHVYIIYEGAVSGYGAAAFSLVVADLRELYGKAKVSCVRVLSQKQKRPITKVKQAYYNSKRSLLQ